MMKARIFAALFVTLAMILSACTAIEPADRTDTETPITASPETNAGASPSPLPDVTENPKTPTPGASPDIDYSSQNQQLAGLLPNEKGYEWRYFGTAEYGHSMTLNSIEQADGETTYSISGSLDDMSGEASNEKLAIEIEYLATEGKLIQKNIKGRSMDSGFQTLILITGPLEKGTTWTQKAVNSDNAEMDLNCAIKDVIDDGCKTYVVRYEQNDGDYYEERMIREGCGVIGFTRLFSSGSDKFDIGFSLYDQMSGYPGELSLKALLPPMAPDMRYNGLAEYGHVVRWDKTLIGSDKTTYEFTGNYDDGSGIPDKFKVDYILDRNASTVTEKVVENERYEKPRMNSIIPDLIILKAPLNQGASWKQQVTIDGKSYAMNALITSVQAAQNDPGSTVYNVKYVVEGIPGYFKNTYLEERKFQAGKGMIGFTNLMPGDIGLSGKDLEDPAKVEEALTNHMFGYGLSLEIPDQQSLDQTPADTAPSQPTTAEAASGSVIPDQVSAQIASGHVAQKILVLNFDPVLESRNNIKLHELGDWWSDPRNLSTQYAADFKEFTGGFVNYEIAGWVDIDEFPRSISGFSYDEGTYLSTYDEACKETGGSYWSSGKWRQNDGFDFDYGYYIKKYNVVDRISKGEIDEVWIFSGPCTGVGAYESLMVGDNAYWCNSPPLVRDDCNPFVIYFFNFERDVGCMIEDAGHRMESIMSHVFGRWDYSVPVDSMNKWEKFSLYDKVSPGNAACGNVHFAPNSEADYDWGNKKAVSSAYVDWLDYPDMTGKAVLADSSAWGGGDMRAHHKWWFSCIPKAEGLDEQGYYNNWWIYFLYPGL